MEAYGFVSVTLLPLYPKRNRPWYRMFRKMSGFRDGLDVTETIKLSCLCQESNPNSSVVQNVATPSYELSHSLLSLRIQSFLLLSCGSFFLLPLLISNLVFRLANYSACYLLLTVFSRRVPPKRRLAFKELQDAISQKI
jgi:hypothetical protein